MSVLLHSDHDEVYKFPETGMEALLYETLAYIEEVKGRGAEIKTITFAATDASLSFNIYYKDGSDRWGKRG